MLLAPLLLPLPHFVTTTRYPVWCCRHSLLLLPLHSPSLHVRRNSCHCPLAVFEQLLLAATSAATTFTAAIGAGATAAADAVVVVVVVVRLVAAEEKKQRDKAVEERRRIPEANLSKHTLVLMWC